MRVVAPRLLRNHASARSSSSCRARRSPSAYSSRARLFSPRSVCRSPWSSAPARGSRRAPRRRAGRRRRTSVRARGCGCEPSRGARVPRRSGGLRPRSLSSDQRSTLRRFSISAESRSSPPARAHSLGLERRASRALAASAKKKVACRRRSSSASPDSSSRSSCVLADRLEHPVALGRLVLRWRSRLLSTSDCERVEVGVADLLGRLERAAAGEDGQPREEPLLLGVEQVVRHSIVARSVCWRGSASRPRREQVEALREPLEELLGREELSAPRRARARAAGCRAAAELGDASSVRRMRSSARAREEELDGRRLGRAAGRGSRARRGAGAARGSSRAACRLGAGGEQVRERAARPRATCSRLSSTSSSRAVADVLGEAVLWRRAPGRPCRSDQRRVAQRRERHPEDAVGVVVGELGGGLEREPRLAGAARPGQRQQADVVLASSATHLGELALAAEERRRRNRAGSSGRGVLQRRELARRRAGRAARRPRDP